MMKRKWYALGALAISGSFLLQNGCLSAFWRGLRDGPTDNQWLNLANDVVNYVLFT
ncbi:MAG: hypothetical protein PVJ57_07555 [Phycisphaerae bacterium]|jgi:hypothetical protein